MSPSLTWSDLPGGERVRRGLDQLERGDIQEEMLLILLAAPALKRVGLMWRAPDDGAAKDPHLRLYASLQKQYGDDAHAQYNALLREIDSFVLAAGALGLPQTV